MSRARPAGQAATIALVGAAALLASSPAFAAPSLNDIPLVTLPPAPSAPPRSIPKGADAAVRVFPSANGSVLVVHKDAGGSPQAQQLGTVERAKLSTTPGTSACIGWAQQTVASFRQSLLYMNREQSVMAVRAEVLEEGKDSATLKIADYWVDPKGGAQAVSSPLEVALKRVTAPSEPAIYAFRTDGAVVLVAGATQGSSFQGSSGRTMSSQCDVAFAEIELKDGAGTVQGQLNRLTMIEETRSRVPDAPPNTMPFQRQLHISASVSQTSRDPAPLFSISTRWLTELPPQFKLQKL